jgi:hypothetical protein
MDVCRLMNTQAENHELDKSNKSIDNIRNIIYKYIYREEYKTLASFSNSLKYLHLCSCSQFICYDLDTHQEMTLISQWQDYVCEDKVIEGAIYFLFHFPMLYQGILSGTITNVVNRLFYPIIIDCLYLEIHYIAVHRVAWFF